MHMKMQIKYKNAGTLFECCHTTEDTQRPTFQERSQKTTMRWNEWQFFRMKLRMECGGVTARTEGRSSEYNFYNSCRRAKREARLLASPYMSTIGNKAMRLLHSSNRSPAWHPAFPRSPLSQKRTMPERPPTTATLPPPLRSVTSLS
jgi:hypothetical protein